MEKFGVFLKELRNNNNFSLRAFAAKISMTPSYLSDIEQGKRNAPTKDYLDRMIKELKRLN
jgi:transcriptional regulator with XRE-family HTH domain